MSTLLSFFLTNPTLIAIFAGVVGGIAWGFKQRLAGANAERAKQAAAETKARDISNEVQNDVGALHPDAARAELNRWSK